MRIPIVAYGPIIEGAGDATGAYRPGQTGKIETAATWTAGPASPAPPQGAKAPVDPHEARLTLGVGKLERQLEWLATNGFQTPILEDFVENRIEGDATAKRVILTFDGGLEAHYKLVFPILQKYKMRATFFIPEWAIDRPGGLARGELEIMVKWGMGMGVLTPPAEELLAMLPPMLHDQLTGPRRRLAEAIGRPVTTIAVPGKQLETSPLARTIHDDEYRGLATTELGNHFLKGELIICARYVMKRTVNPEEWKNVVRMSSMGPAKLSFFVRPLK